MDATGRVKSGQKSRMVLDEEKVMPEPGSPKQQQETSTDDPSPPETLSDEALQSGLQFLDAAESTDLWDDAD